MKMEYLEPLIAKIEVLLKENGKVTVAIDGCAASGKSTAAEYLGKYFGGNVIHMDDFFLPMKLRTPERMKQPAGNIHYERLQEQICRPFAEQAAFQYIPYDCCSDTYQEGIQMNPTAVTIFEGAYSMYPGKIPYEVSVFFKSSPQVQYQRVLKRNGPEKLKAFQDRFIPMEHRYFEAFHIPETADFFFDTSVLF